MKKQLRIFHGIQNIGGIGRYMADYERSKGHISDFIVFSDFTMRRNNHYNLMIDRYSKDRQILIRLSLLLLCLFKYDIFHFYFGKSFLPYNLDLPVLKLFKKKMLMTYCGSEVRLIKIERRRNKYFNLLKIGLNHPNFDHKKEIMMKWQSLWINKFIAPRDLYASVSSIIPKSKIVKNLWIHNTMDFKNYIEPVYENKKIPVLVHAPSELGIKGTKYVRRAVEKLKSRGIKFEYFEIHKVSNSEAKRIYREKADIIIDQFLLGSFGTLAVEGMYYGKPVCSYIIEEIKKEHFPDCPIVSSTIEDLDMVLERLINNLDERIKIGKLGRSYVEKYFNREKVGNNLLQLYRQL